MNYLGKRNRTLLGLGIGLSLAACNDAGSDESVATATVDPATAQLALSELTSNVDLTITGFTSARPASVVLDAEPDGPAIAVRCAAGGMASVGGRVNVVPVPVTVDVSVAIDYNGCTTNNGATLAGNLDFVQKVAAGGTPVRVETIYQGDVSFTGSVQASCPVDVHVLVDETGRTVEVSGAFCGHDASTLNLQVTPRWTL